MDRQIIYPGQVPLDTDQLAQNKNAMLGLGFLAQAILGTGTYADGLNCAPTTPASLNVLVSAGSIYSLQNVDNAAYGGLAADTANQVVKQGIILGTTTFAITPPGTVGQSQVYLVQAAFQSLDDGSTVLPYYNAANPNIPYSGPGNSGVAQYTARRGVCVLSLKAGVAATTGTQAAPAPDVGYVGLWAITVANGATTITGGNIAQAANAPFIVPNPQKLNVNSNLSDVASATTALANLGGPFVKTVKSRSYATSGTYTPSAGMLYCIVEIVGGGGGGGGSAANVTYGAAAGGGGAGGYARGIFSAASIGASMSVTVGASGAAGASGSGTGGTGGTTSFASLSAAGGSGGAAGAASTTTGRGGPGGIGGSSTGGDTNSPGSAGSAGLVLAGSALGGQGGASFFGGATLPVVENTSGLAGTANGGGGGGGASLGNASAGGQGASGLVRITEYCSQ